MAAYIKEYADYATTLMALTVLPGEADKYPALGSSPDKCRIRPFSGPSVAIKERWSFGGRGWIKGEEWMTQLSTALDAPKLGGSYCYE